MIRHRLVSLSKSPLSIVGDWMNVRLRSNLLRYIYMSRGSTAYNGIGLASYSNVG